jgi:peptidoglycan hydrolase-like protein with peptidoglycan-binding domain
MTGRAIPLAGARGGEQCLRLRADVHADPQLVADGVYGPATVNAVKWWQHKQGIEETGAASELTLALLFAARIVKGA